MRSMSSRGGRREVGSRDGAEEAENPWKVERFLVVGVKRPEMSAIRVHNLDVEGGEEHEKDGLGEARSGQ